MQQLKFPTPIPASLSDTAAKLSVECSFWFRGIPVTPQTQALRDASPSDTTDAVKICSVADHPRVREVHVVSGSDQNHTLGQQAGSSTPLKVPGPVPKDLTAVINDMARECASWHGLPVDPQTEATQADPLSLGSAMVKICSVVTDPRSREVTEARPEITVSPNGIQTQSMIPSIWEACLLLLVLSAVPLARRLAPARSRTNRKH